VSELLILIEGVLAARVHANKSGQLSLSYESRWRESPQGYSLSATLPRSPIIYSHKAVWTYLWNLLPENPNVLQRWGQQYHVSAGNPFKLLAHVGADVPGAAQFIPAEQQGAFETERRPKIDWLSDIELRERLRQLSDEASAVRRPGDIGKLSLPGVQAKTAYYLDPQTRRWGIPGGRTPTTHIIKPCIPGFDGLVENEHLCMEIAARLGLPAAKSFVLALDQSYIAVERFDRLPPSRASPFPRRIQQEDLCQALGLMPAKKYQQDGGPGIADIVKLLRRVSAAPGIDLERFFQANILNWLIGGTDAHAKNYSLLIGAGDEIRLAPLYDLSSQLPFPELISQRVAMKIGDHYEIPLVNAVDWRKLARACSMEEDHVIGMVMQTARALPDAVSDARAQALSDGLSDRVVSVLARQLTAHAHERLAAVTSVSSNTSRHRRSRRRRV
jgi:serine/threonine-protein kinase HipA